MSTTTHYYKKIFCEMFWNYFRRRAALKTALVNASINRGGQFWLTEAFFSNVSQNPFTKTVIIIEPASRNHPIF